MCLGANCCSVLQNPGLGATGAAWGSNSSCSLYQLEGRASHTFKSELCIPSIVCWYHLYSVRNNHCDTPTVSPHFPLSLRNQGDLFLTVCKSSED